MTVLKSKRGKVLQFSMTSTLNNILQLNNILSLPDLPLNKILEVYLYNSYKNVVKYMLLAQVVVETNENYYI